MTVMSAKTPWWEDVTATLTEASGERRPIDAVEAIVQLLAATQQPMLTRQLVLKLERFGHQFEPTTLDAQLAADPRLHRDDLGRWRFVGAASSGQ